MFFNSGSKFPLKATVTEMNSLNGTLFLETVYNQYMWPYAWNASKGDEYKNKMIHPDIKQANQNKADICRVAFQENGANELPEFLKRGNIYYAKAHDTTNAIKIYNTLQDAINETNVLSFTAAQVKLNYYLVFIDSNYYGIVCAEYANENPYDIICCPEITEHRTDGIPRHFNFDWLDFGNVEVTLASRHTTGTWNIYLKTSGYHSHRTLHKFVKNYGNNFPEYIDWIIMGDFYKGVYSVRIYAIYTGFSLSNSTIENFYGNFLYAFSLYYESNQKNGTYQINHPISETITNILGFELPTSIEVTWDGNVFLPNTIKVSLPDAYFHDATNPVQLGDIEETLTLVPEHSVYYSDVLDLYKIPGRINVSVLNLLPLVTNPFNESYPFNYFANNVGDFLYVKNYPNYGYEDVAPGMTGYTSYFTGYTSYFIGSNGVETSQYLKSIPYGIWVGNTAYDGYGADYGLQQGDIWFDSRIVENKNNTIKRKPTITVVNYSSFRSARFGGSGGGPLYDNGFLNSEDELLGLYSFYKSPDFYIVSKHPNCYLSSLEV